MDKSVLFGELVLMSDFLGDVFHRGGVFWDFVVVFSIWLSNDISFYIFVSMFLFDHKNGSIFLREFLNVLIFSFSL